MISPSGLPSSCILMFANATIGLAFSFPIQEVISGEISLFKVHYNTTVVLYLDDGQKELTRFHTKRILEEIHSAVAVHNKKKAGLKDQILDNVLFSRFHQLQPVTFTSYVGPSISQ